MPTTTKYAFRYPAASDAPNGPLQLQQLAQDVEAGMTKSYAVYSASANQSLGNMATTNLALSTTNISSSAVSRQTSGAGHQFVLGRKGVWIAQAYCRVQGGGSAAYTGLNITSSATGHATVPNAEVTSGFTVLGVTALILAENGDTVTAAIYHERGSTVSTLATMTGIRLAWLGLI